MSWINHILPKIKREEAPKKPSPIPEGVWTKCPGCEQALYTEELDRSLRVCPKCGYHFRMGARVRLHAFLDPATAVEIGAEIRTKDPLHFVDSKPYPARHAASEASTHETDALVVMSGLLRREPMVAAAFEFGFMGGSMGSVVGERFALGVEEAIRRRAPFRGVLRFQAEPACRNGFSPSCRWPRRPTLRAVLRITVFRSSLC